MKIGLMSYNASPMRRIWDLISKEICEPLEFIPFGNWTIINGSIVDSVHYGIIDSHIFHWAMSSARSKYVQFSYPIRHNYLVLVLPNTKVVSSRIATNWQSTISMFSTNVWLVISLLFIMLLLYNWLGSSPISIPDGQRDGSSVGVWEWWAIYDDLFAPSNA